MEVCRLPGHLPPINLRYRQASPFHPFLVRCNLPQDTKTVEYSNGRMFILGMGFVGQFFAADLKSKGWIVSGSCTSIEKKTKLEDMGYNAYVFDANDPQPEILDIMKNYTHLLVSIPPVKGLGDPMLHHKELVKNRLRGGKLQWLTYLSSTSVYGDCDGAFVDEDYPLSPTNELARARLAAEEVWLCLGHDLGIAAHIFRLGGIYGPGRSAIDTIIKQATLSKSQKMRLSKQYTTRVHVADICQALNASILKRPSWEIYNIVDDDPAPRKEVFMFAQDLIEQKLPGNFKQDISPETLTPDKDSKGEKRVSNARMKEELGVKLFHASYRSGLQSIIDNMDSSFMQNLQGS